MKIKISDDEFLNWFDLSRPSMKQAAALRASGDVHGAALAAACAACEGPRSSVIEAGSAIAKTRDAIRAHVPGAAEQELAVAKLLESPEIPGPNELGPVDNLVLGVRARTARKRGNDALTFALLYATTGEKRFAAAAISAGVKRAAEILPYPEGDSPPAYAWHPHDTEATHGHETAHQVQYWMQAWPLLDDAMQPEDRLAWMKVIIVATRDRYRANRHEIPFNLTLHPLMPALQVAVAFPALKESPEWLAFMTDRMENDFCAPPFATPDGYTREGPSYHNVNTRLLTLAHLTLLRGAGKDSAVIRGTLEKAHALQAAFLCPDGTKWMLGDSFPLAFHEHWQDAHESLHLAAALFDRPEWKLQAGSLKTTTPELLNLWMMGAEGIARWKSFPEVNLTQRLIANSHAPQSVFHTLRAGKGVDGHAGILAFGSEHNHAHHDKGSVLIYGLGRHLLSDTGHPGYGPSDMNPGFSTKVHSVINIIRRTPLGPRTDYADHVKSLGVFESDTVSVAMGEHSYFENHIIRRALALVSPHGRTSGDDAFWIVLDRVTWKRGWPPNANEPNEMIDTVFPFHVPGVKPDAGAKVSADGRSTWSLHGGPEGAPYVDGGPPRVALRTATEQSDSDANLQITRLETSGSSAQWDIELREGWTNAQGGDKAPRPMAAFRWRGKLPHLSAYVLVPYRGLRETEFVHATGTMSADGCVARVGNFEARVSGFESGKLSAEVKRKQ